MSYKAIIHYVIYNIFISIYAIFVCCSVLMYNQNIDIEKWTCPDANYSTSR